MKIPDSVIRSVRDALPRVVAVLDSMDRTWRAVFALVGLLGVVASGWLAVRYDLGETVLTTLTQLGSALLIVAVSAAGAPVKKDQETTGKGESDES